MKNWLKYTVLVLLVGILLFGIVACINLIGAGPQTPSQAAMFSIILTMLSVLAGWLITHIYSEIQHQEAIEQVEAFYKKNLRTYAIKASEKVENLSAEFGRLAGFLEEEEEGKLNQETDEALLSKKERIKGAIHIINTLKSMNDTSLSDWEGVIDDILDRKRQEQEEQAENFMELVEKVEPILKTDVSEDVITLESPEAQHLGNSIEALRKDIRTAIHQMGSGTLRLPRVQSSLEDVVAQCPACSELVTYKQGKFSKKIRGLKCLSCQTQLISQYNEEKGNFVLQVRKPMPEIILCPGCQAEIKVELDLIKTPPVELKCPKCAIEFFARRKHAKIIIASKEQNVASEKLSGEIIENVKKEMPPQPWHKWAHKEVATKLGLPERTVQSAIAHLIKSGVFYHQIDGKVYVPRDDIPK
jgi:DNA-directed RNA polymerase subunit M/transcription elongation factor TFIIS